MAKILSGGCLCGAMRYEYTGIPEGAAYYRFDFGRAVMGFVMYLPQLHRYDIRFFGFEI